MSFFPLLSEFRCFEVCDPGQHRRCIRRNVETVSRHGRTVPVLHLDPGRDLVLAARRDVPAWKNGLGLQQHGERDAHNGELHVPGRLRCHLDPRPQRRHREICDLQEARVSPILGRSFSGTKYSLKNCILVRTESFIKSLILHI